jgi:serine/threonine-protein kinase HipA
MTTSDSVQVCLDLEVARLAADVGWAHRQASGSGEIFSFEYSPLWLQDPHAFTFDPDLALVAGRQYPTSDRAAFGMCMDSSPDRWGGCLCSEGKTFELVASSDDRKR